ncbi:MAG: hypothetical protein GPJ51_15120 [Candidatus Heimdallarchaeota archaeon]|nr:hypothetical protein [Candidatus Heimdallarchaeota archaeon]
MKKLRFAVFIVLLLVALTYTNESEANLPATSEIFTTAIPYETPSNILNSLTPHTPINITSDADFIGFPGNGTRDDPYRIENFNISHSEVTGIRILNTTKYFVIQNCYLDSLGAGITIASSVTWGTCKVLNNVCCNMQGYGISGQNINATFSGNTIYNTTYGITFFGSHGFNINNNTVYDNEWGIFLDSCGTMTLLNNTVFDNQVFGIRVWSAFAIVKNHYLGGNICYNNVLGIDADSFGNLTLTDNTCYNNSVTGLTGGGRGEIKVVNNNCSFNGESGLFP